MEIWFIFPQNYSKFVNQTLWKISISVNPFKSSLTWQAFKQFEKSRYQYQRVVLKRWISLWVAPSCVFLCQFWWWSWSKSCFNLFKRYAAQWGIFSFFSKLFWRCKAPPTGWQFATESIAFKGKQYDHLGWENDFKR